jgi:hypothetical protein
MVRRRKRQPCCIVQDLPLLWRELVESAGLEGALPRIGRHGSQSLDGASHRLLAVGPETTEL